MRSFIGLIIIVCAVQSALQAQEAAKLKPLASQVEYLAIRAARESEENAPGWGKIQSIVNARIMVQMKNGERYKGRLEEWSDSEIAVVEKQGNRFVATKADVAKVSVPVRTPEAGAKVGAITGGIIGAVIFGGLAAAFSEGHYEELGGPIFLGGAIGAGIGAGVGAIFGKTEEFPVYIAPRQEGYF